jgi:hypothetical protein
VLPANTAGATSNTPGFGRAKVDPKKKKSVIKNQWHWRELNPSVLHGSPVPNQLDHGGQLEL